MSALRSIAGPRTAPSFFGPLPYPVPTSDAATRTMRGNRRTKTRPEVRLRSALHVRGLRFRVDYRIEAGERPVRTDVAFTRRRLAVFVDGCFWHRCPLHFALPRANREYWETKLAGNSARDAAGDARLQAAGWRVLRVWEHEEVGEAAARIVAELERDG